MGRHKRVFRQRYVRCKRCGQPIAASRMKAHWRQMHVKPEDRRS